MCKELFIHVLCKFTDQVNAGLFPKGAAIKSKVIIGIYAPVLIGIIAIVGAALLILLMDTLLDIDVGDITIALENTCDAVLQVRMDQYIQAWNLSVP